MLSRSHALTLSHSPPPSPSRATGTLGRPLHRGRLRLRRCDHTPRFAAAATLGMDAWRRRQCRRAARERGHRGPQRREPAARADGPPVCDAARPDRRAPRCLLTLSKVALIAAHTLGCSEPSHSPPERTPPPDPPPPATHTWVLDFSALSPSSPAHPLLAPTQVLVFNPPYVPTSAEVRIQQSAVSATPACVRMYACAHVHAARSCKTRSTLSTSALHGPAGRAAAWCWTGATLALTLAPPFAPAPAPALTAAAAAAPAPLQAVATAGRATLAPRRLLLARRQGECARRDRRAARRAGAPLCGLTGVRGGGSTGFAGVDRRVYRGWHARTCVGLLSAAVLVGRAGLRLAHGGGASRAERAALRDALRA